MAVCDCKSFTLASTRVHKSQGAISAQIANLENQTGSKLIERSRRQFRLTREGELFLTFAQEIIAKTDAAQQELQALRNSVRGEVRVGATRSIGIHILPDALSSIAKEFPDLKMSLLTQPRGPTYECLQRDALDLGVVLADAVPRGLFARRLRSVSLCFVISPKHPLAAQKAVSRKELETVPFVSGIKGNDLSDLIDEVFKKHGITKPMGCVSVSSLRARKAAVRAGLGVTVLPDFAVREELKDKTLQVLTIKDGGLPDTQLMIVEPHRRSPNANVQRVKNALKEKLAADGHHGQPFFYSPVIDLKSRIQRSPHH